MSSLQTALRVFPNKLENSAILVVFFSFSCSYNVCYIARIPGTRPVIGPLSVVNQRWAQGAGTERRGVESLYAYGAMPE